MKVLSLAAGGRCYRGRLLYPLNGRVWRGPMLLLHGAGLLAGSEQCPEHTDLCGQKLAMPLSPSLKCLCGWLDTAWRGACPRSGGAGLATVSPARILTCNRVGHTQNVHHELRETEALPRHISLPPCPTARTSAPLPWWHPTS